MNGYAIFKATNHCLHAKCVGFVIFVVILGLVATPGTVTAGTDVNNFQPVTNEMLLSAQDDPDTWLMYGRDYRSWRYSELTQINTENVKNSSRNGRFKLEQSSISLNVPHWSLMA